jgi:hypothetical protein
MSRMPVQDPQGGGRISQGQGIPGISAAELEVMQAAAALSLAGQDTGMATVGMRLLRRPAGPGAAGAVSPLRDQYRKQQGVHFMLMPYSADGRSQA